MARDVVAAFDGDGIRFLADGTPQVLNAAGEWEDAQGRVYMPVSNMKSLGLALVEVVALKADNAALVRQMGLLHDAVGDFIATESYVDETLDAQHDATGALLAQPHPGAALLEEMKALRERAEKAEVEVDAWKEASGLVGSDGDPARVTPDHLSRDLQRRDADLEVARAQVNALGLQIQECEARRAEAGMALATARDAALEEAAKVADFSADDASGSGFTSDPDDEDGRKMWALVEERHRQDAAAIRALKSSPARFVPEAEVAKAQVEVLALAAQHVERRKTWVDHNHRRVLAAEILAIADSLGH